MDKKIQDAIRESIAEAGQDPGLARQLESWFEALASGNEDINDKQSSHRRLDHLHAETHVASAPTPSSMFSLDDVDVNHQEPV